MVITRRVITLVLHPPPYVTCTNIRLMLAEGEHLAGGGCVTASCQKVYDLLPAHANLIRLYLHSQSKKADLQSLLDM